MSHECRLVIATSSGLHSAVTRSIAVLSKWILDDAFLSLLALHYCLQVFFSATPASPEVTTAFAALSAAVTSAMAWSGTQ